jgi:tetratricopeptide (TPR) repeat protein
MMRCTTLVIGLAVAAYSWAPVSGQVTDGPSAAWRRLRSPNFVAIGNATEADIRAATAELESVRDAMASRFPSLARRRTTLPTLVVFKDDRALAVFKPRDEPRGRHSTTAGFFVARPDVTYIVLSSQPVGSVGRDSMLRIVLHEYVHDIIQREKPFLPLWLNEGLSEFYGSAERATGKVVAGRALEDRLDALARYRRLPIEELISVSDYATLRGGQRELVFYAQSWALTHYLLVGHDGRRDGQLDAFMDAVERGLSAESAFEEAFETSIDAMSRELDLYIRRSQFPTMTLTEAAVDGWASTGRFEPMLESEAARIEGDVLLRLGLLDDANDRLTPAAARYPASAPLQMSLAILRTEQGRASEAVALLREVVAGDPDGFAGHWNLARALRRAGLEGEALESYRRAIALNPALAPGWVVDGPR